MPFELYLIGFIILFIPAAIVGLVGGFGLGLLRYGIPYLTEKRRKRIARETRAAAEREASRRPADEFVC